MDQPLNIDFDHWEKQGFLIFKNLFDESEINNFSSDIDLNTKIYSNLYQGITVDILEGPSLGQRKKLSQLNEQERVCSMKINDLFLELDSCRKLCLADKLCFILNKLLNDTCSIINSLTFNKGSQQPCHFDTFYMPPPTQGKMVVASICLENQSANSGPLVYYPGSHLIKPYVFSHGGIHALEEEMRHALSYVKNEIESRNLNKEVFIGNKGDVFIWHGQLYHGGNEIIDHSLTRKTLVTHYWRKTDLDEKRVVEFGKYGSYLKRNHQKV